MMRRFISVGLTMATVLAFCLLPGGKALAAGTTYKPATWNGKKVYLSPAKHSPENYGCSNYAESPGARAIALATKDKLVSYGYEVRVGDGDYVANTSDSNSYNPQLHVPIHSNAGTSDCAGTTASHGGTWVMYVSTAGQSASTAILNAMKAYSPGTNDKICTDTTCSGKNLYELRSTTAVAAYVEAAFHTYGPDMNWLKQSASVGLRVANGIDNYFGSPRAAVAPAPAATTSATPPTAFAIPAGGTDSPHLEAAFATALAGPTDGTVAVFSPKTAGMVRGVRLVNGLAIVDFHDFSRLIPNAQTSAGSAQLLAELNGVAFSFSEVSAVVYRFNGDCNAFAGWLEATCAPTTRADWEAFKAQQP